MRIKRIIITVLCVILLIGGSAGGYFYYQLSKVKTTKVTKSDKALGIKTKTNTNTSTDSNTEKADTSITNIALFGVDSRTKQSEGSNSDSIMILSIDKLHKKIKLSSIMRDSYVSIDGHDKSKINAAYLFGGPELAIKTLNENFDMDIRDFVTVNFYSMEKIIDYLGGVQINIKASEVDEVNKYIHETASNEKEKAVYISHSGLQDLNGLQAVSYARIRYVGNGDFERTQRQDTVLTALINKVQQAGASKYPSIATQILPYVETSLSSIDIIKLGTDVLTTGITNVEWQRYPVDGYCNQLVKDGVWYLSVDIDATKNQIHDFIYNDIKPVPKTPLF